MTFYSTGFCHWGLQRTSALFLIGFIFSLFCVESLYINNLILVLIVLHFKLGFETLFEDYVHNSHLKEFGLILLRLSGIYVVKLFFFVVIL